MASTGELFYSLPLSKVYAAQPLLPTKAAGQGRVVSFIAAVVGGSNPPFSLVILLDGSAIYPKLFPIFFNKNWLKNYMQHPSTFYGTYGNQKSQLHSPSKTLQAWQSQMGTWVYRCAPNILREEKNIPYI
jgi:hypothetical protein